MNGGRGSCLGLSGLLIMKIGAGDCGIVDRSWNFDATDTDKTLRVFDIF